MVRTVLGQALLPEREDRDSFLLTILDFRWNIEPGVIPIVQLFHSGPQLLAPNAAPLA